MMASLTRLLALLALLAVTLSANAEDDVNFVSDLPQCSNPISKFVYIKTHKTGSSTITNMLHRYANKHGLHLALPKDNTFYSWPILDKKRILNSIWDYEPQETFDGLCSAHVRFESSALDKLVPDAKYVTVLRSPATHVKSSWSYWNVPGHIRANGGPSLTLDQFMENPDKYWRVANRGDRMLLLNSQAFDLGLSNSPSKAEAEQLMKTLDKRFFVLITDHMDESLVMLKRQFCWETDDILYISLKRSHRRAENTAKMELRNQRIRKMNWADQMLFDHFNKTLWDYIENAQGFKEELQYFKERKEQLSSYCRKFTNFDDVRRRKFIEEKKHTNERDRMCHLVMMDSQAFSKHFKWKEGADPSNVECLTQGNPRPNAILARVDGVPDAVVGNLMYNRADAHDQAIAIPRATRNTDKGGIRADFLTAQTRGSKRSFPYGIIVGRNDTPLVTSKAVAAADRRPATVAAVMDPVQRFLMLWHELKVDEMLGGTPMETYLEDPEKFTGPVPKDVQLRLHDGMARWLGYTDTSTFAVDQAKARATASRLSSLFAVGMVVEHWFESMVLLRRVMCWSQPDMEYIAHRNNPNLPDSATLEAVYEPREVSDSLRAKILRVNRVDQALHNTFNTTLWRKLAREMSLQEEVSSYKEHLKAVLNKCSPVINASAAEIKAIALNGKGSDRRCARMMAPPQVLWRAAKEKKPSRWNYVQD